MHHPNPRPDKTVTLPPTSTRVCQHCLKAKPLTDFRRRSRDSSVRLNQCQSCHNEAERLRSAQKRTKGNRRHLARRLTELKNAQSKQRVEFLCGLMLQEFGGLEGFVRTWADYSQRAMRQGGFAAYRCLASITQLVQHVEASKPDLSDLTNEDLERELMEGTKRLIRQQPELAVSAAEGLGWNVTPPPE